MATVGSIAKRRSEAETAIKNAVSALADKAGIELTESDNYAARDIEIRRIIDLENVAGQLTQIVDGFAEKAKPKTEATKSK